LSRTAWALFLVLFAAVSCSREGGDAAPPPPRPPVTVSWARVPATEPEPAARALYRGAIDRAARGDKAGAEAMLKALREAHSGSRFARRLGVEGAKPAGAIALIGLMGALLAPALAGVEAAGEP